MSRATRLRWSREDPRKPQDGIRAPPQGVCPTGLLSSRVLGGGGREEGPLPSEWLVRAGVWERQWGRKGKDGGDCALLQAQQPEGEGLR